MQKRLLTFTASALALAAMPVLAETSVHAVTELNLRAGPGPDQEIIGVIAKDGSVEVEGCLDSGNWCEVSYDGKTGWAYGEYLSDASSDEPVPIVSPETTVEVGTVTYENEEQTGAVVSSGTMGAIVGGVTGGPAGAVAGAIAGGTAGAVVEPGEETVSYVRTHEAEPVYLEGEVVTGVQLPDSVELQEIPDSELRYAYLNGLPVLVETDSRTVVHIVR